MTYSFQTAEPAPADILLPSDGGNTPFELNPTAGTQFSSATPSDAPVVIDGLELSHAQALALGYIKAPEAPQMSAQQPEADQLPAQDAQDGAEDAAENTEGNEDAIISDEAVGLLDSLMTDRGDVVASAITDVLESGDVSEQSLEDIARSSGLDVNQSSELFSQVSDYLNHRLEGKASLLELSNETDPTATKSAIMSALNGADEDAQRLVALTESTMDVSSRSEELVEGLEDAGYSCDFRAGRLYVSGNEYGTTPQPWSRVYSQFDMTLG